MTTTSELLSQIYDVTGLSPSSPSRVRQYEDTVIIKIAFCMFQFKKGVWVCSFEAGEYTYTGKDEDLSVAWKHIKTNVEGCWIQHREIKRVSSPV